MCQILTVKRDTFGKYTAGLACLSILERPDLNKPKVEQTEWSCGTYYQDYEVELA